MNQPMPLAVAVLSLLVAGWSVSTARRSAAESERLQAEVATLRADLDASRSELSALTLRVGSAETLAQKALFDLAEVAAGVEGARIRHDLDRLLDGKRAHP